MEGTAGHEGPFTTSLPPECGQRSLVGCRLWDRTELDTTEATSAAAADFTYYFNLAICFLTEFSICIMIY